MVPIAFIDVSPRISAAAARDQSTVVNTVAVAVAAGVGAEYSAVIDQFTSGSSYSSSSTDQQSPANSSDNENNQEMTNPPTPPSSRQPGQYESSSSDSSSFSYSNAAEAEVLCGVVQGLLDKGITLDKVRLL